MRNDTLFNFIDTLIDVVDQSPASKLSSRLIDTPLSLLESRMGLGPDAMRVYYGNAIPERKSLILNYLESVKLKIRDGEPDAGESTESAEIDPEPFLSKTSKKSRRPDIRGIRKVAKTVLDKKPNVLENDTLTPYERVKRHIEFENPDRVAVAPLPGFNIPHAAGITVREFMTDGLKAAQACHRYHDIHGGFDMLPIGFPCGYLFPLVPETHSRFCSKWVLPDENELPKMEEIPLLPGYEEILSSGIIGMTRTEGGKLLREFRRTAIQAVIFAAGIATYFPRMDLYHTYAAGIVNHPADLLSMWKGFENFMMDCVTDPLKVRETCEMLAPGLVDFGIFTANLTGSKHLLYGASRISGSWISRKMFDDLFAGSFKSQAEQLVDRGFTITYHLDNDYTPMLDFFLDLPRKSGMLHLDQTDMLKAKEKLHGHLCLMGNLHPGISAAGTPGEVEHECERLIKGVGADGGFILSSACEVPMDAPVENVRAMKNAVDKWGWY